MKCRGATLRVHYQRIPIKIHFDRVKIFHTGYLIMHQHEKHMELVSL